MSLPDKTAAADLEVRPHERSVLVHGHDVPVTPREFDIVMMLAEHPGWVFSATQLAGEPEEGDYSPESVSVLVSRLRQKFAAAGASDVIVTVRGFGYRLRSLESLPIEAESDPGASREVREAWWHLQEAVIEVEHSGTPRQQRGATQALEQARHAIYFTLAE